jgi:MraZ protein
VEENVNQRLAEHPRGIYPARVDEKGRLKLPVDFQNFLTALGETKVFVTSLDERIGRIYPISVWKEMEQLFRNAGDDAEAAEDLWFTANDLGGDAEMDAQGRVLMPAELRKALNIENQQVHLEHYKGHIKLYSGAVYQERKQRAAEGRAEKLKLFERRGLQ